MKETVTIYRCTCGRETDLSLVATFHQLKCKCSFSRVELTKDEYALWKMKHYESFGAILASPLSKPREPTF